MSYVLIRRRLLALLLAAAVFANVPAYASGPQPPLRSYNSKGELSKLVHRMSRWGSIAVISFFVYQAFINGTTDPRAIINPFGDRAIGTGLGHRYAKAAQAKHHIDEYIHYIDQEGNAGIGKVVRTFQDVHGETFLLEDGNEVDADQLMGVSRGNW